ncbi:MAG TPA: rhomboid family intramembrane serine protease [Isosphaeraceae bacterium]|jgi:membrane associated rhomboid family serine protease|nr:rhomboid family intramembrane serine protease [Isosphaeraceae bacterium]
MLAVIPWGTDAPIYHFPWATVGLIVATSLVFVITGPADRVDFEPAEVESALQLQDENAAAQAKAKLAEADQKGEEAQDEDESQFAVARGLERWVLVHGNGLHPLQWITSNFIHANIGHLLGNMLFLWSFGIVVEGKIGWWRFLLVYLSIGIAECATEQILTLGSSASVSYGASAIVYSLLAMSLVWAPKNDLSCWVFIWYFLRFHFNDYEIPIYWFATFYIATEAITIPLSGFAITSSLLHVLGAAWGFALGTLMLKADWVDCENWDFRRCD